MASGTTDVAIAGIASGTTAWPTAEIPGLAGVVSTTTCILLSRSALDSHPWTARETYGKNIASAIRAAAITDGT